jgi:hypothetical protein
MAPFAAIFMSSSCPNANNVERSVSNKKQKHNNGCGAAANLTHLLPRSVATDQVFNSSKITGIVCCYLLSSEYFK